MENRKNFFQRAMAAIVEGRTRQAERYLAQFERRNGLTENKVNGR